MNQGPPLFPCPACSERGWIPIYSCCGVAEGLECCGDPEMREMACALCSGEGRACLAAILRHAQEQGDLALHAQHEAMALLEGILPSHPARRLKKNEAPKGPASKRL